MKKICNIVFNTLILFGVILVSVDAFIFQHNARKREAERCQQIQKLTISIMLYAHDQTLVVNNAQELLQIAEEPESYKWNLGENVKGGKK